MPSSEPKRLGQRAAAGGGLMVAARLLTRLIDLGTLLVLTRILLPTDFGLVAIAMTLVYVTEAALEMPLNQALLRLPDITRAHYDTAFTIGLLRAVVLVTIFLAGAVPFARLYGDGRLVLLVCVLGLAPAARSLQSPRLAEFQKSMSFWRDFAVELSGKLVAFASCTAVALLTHSYWAIAVGSVIYPVAMAVQSYLFAPYRPRLALSEFRVFADFVGWMSAAQLVGAVNWQLERLLLGKLEPMARLGLFTTASDLANIPFLAMFGPMARPLLAAFTHLQDDPARLRSSYQRASAAMVALGLPLLVGDALVAEPTVRLILGARWMGAAFFVRWLSLSLIPALFTLPTVSLLMAFGRPRIFFVRNLFEISLKAPLAVAGVLTLGFTGVIIARFASELSVDIFCLFVVRRLIGLGFREQVLVSWGSMVATALMAAAVLTTLALLPPAHDAGSAALALALAVPAGAAVYALVLFGSWAAAGRPPGIESMAARSLAGTAGRARLALRRGRHAGHPAI